MNKNKTIIIVLVLLLASAVCCVISIAGYFIYDKYKDRKEDDKETESNNEIGNTSSSTTTTKVDEDKDDEEIVIPTSHQYIKGNLGFPSEYIPPLKVCAEDVLLGEFTCIETAENQTEYSIEVQPASYYVYSEVLTGGGGYEGYRAYYNDFVLCGMSVECTSHNPVVVNVNVGETVNNIDPIDWYNF